MLGRPATFIEQKRENDMSALKKAALKDLRAAEDERQAEHDELVKAYKARRDLMGGHLKDEYTAARARFDEACHRVRAAEQAVRDAIESETERTRGALRALMGAMERLNAPTAEARDQAARTGQAAFDELQRLSFKGWNEELVEGEPPEYSFEPLRVEGDLPPRVRMVATKAYENTLGGAESKRAGEVITVASRSVEGFIRDGKAVPLEDALRVPEVKAGVANVPFPRWRPELDARVSAYDGEHNAANVVGRSA